MQVIQTTQVRQVEGVESSSQETRAERPFRRAGALDFSPHPFAVHAVLREHQQQAVVDLDGPVDLLDEFPAPLHVFRSEPDPQLFATHLLVQWVAQLRRT